MVGDTQLVMPNIVDTYNQGAAQGRADRTRRTLSQYLQPALGGDQSALAQIYSADPQAGVQTQNEAFHQQQQAYTQQQQTQQSDQQNKQFADADLQRLGQHARLIANAAQSGNMDLANSIYQSIYPEASKILGSNLPQTLTPDQLPNIQKLADTVAPLPQAKPEFQSAVPTGQMDANNNPITQAGWVQYGKPFQPLQGPGGAQVATPPPNLNAAPQGTLAQAVMAQESGGNPNAVSPKGAQGLMQLMPATAANPGFGIQPARDNSPQENMRVGSQYLTALGNKYGGDTNLTLAAYNAGPGRVDQALQAAGGDPTKALASLPAETQAYVPGVENRMGGTPSAQPLAFGQSAKAAMKQNAPSGYRFKADGSGDLEPIPGGPNDAKAQVADSGLSQEALTDAAWDKIFNGKDIPGMGKAAVQQRAAVRNQVAQIAKDAGVSPQDLVTTAGRNKALQASLTNLQKKSDAMAGQEVAFNRNLDYAQQISSQIERTGSPALNKWILGAKEQMGDPDVVKLDAALTPVAADYARIMSGATGSGGTPITTMEEAKTMLRKQLSDKQFGAVADVLRNDIKNQQDSTADQLDIVRSHMSQFGQSQQSPSSKPASNSGWSIQLVNQ